MQDSLKLVQKVYARAIVGTMKELGETICKVHSGNAEVEILKLAVSFVELPKDEEQQPIG